MKIRNWRELFGRHAEYLLFAGHRYYPAGGADDFRFRGAIDECKAWFATHPKEIADTAYIDNWGQIVDPHTMKVIWIGQQSQKQDRSPGEISWRLPDI